jgi:LCP family protein required for cell wall assembly
MKNTNEPDASSQAPSSERALHSRFRRARKMSGAMGVTTLGTLLPGSGYLFTGRRVLGLAVLLPAVALAGFVGSYLFRDLDAALRFAFDPQRLTIAATVMVGVLLIWVAVVITTYVMVRPLDRGRLQKIVGGTFVALLCMAVAAPLAVAARYSMVQADLVTTIFEDNESATTPIDVTVDDPWGGRERVSLLLLGGDGSVQREGVRTDSMIVASMEVDTGRTTLFSLPRNLMNVPFPEDSPLAEIYPLGYRGGGDQSNWMLNAVYPLVPTMHPNALGKSDNEGADALKEAVEGALGLPVDYYMLVNLAGFRTIVDAMGGVTVNINEPIPIGGQPGLGIPPETYIDPGPDRRLDGFEALWFSRGRYGSDDYDRMERQRCMVDALIDEARPFNLLRRYQALAAAGKKIVRTDVPRDLLPAFLDLTMKVKDSPVESVVFVSSEKFSPADPDFAWMHDKVRKALKPPDEAEGNEQRGGAPVDDSPSGSPSPAPGSTTGNGSAAESCQYTAAE